MVSDFKVMKWLRSVRDANAAAEHGMSSQDRLTRTEEETRDVIERMLKDPRSSSHQAGEWRKARKK